MASLPSARVPKWWYGCQNPACQSPAGEKQHPTATTTSFFFFAVLLRKDSTLLTFLIWSDVIGLPSLDMAPSATMITLRREPRLLCCQDNQSVPLCRLNSRRGGFKSKVTFRHSYVCQPPAQMVLPALIWGHLWDEDPVSTAGLGRHQGQVPAAI